MLDSMIRPLINPPLDRIARLLATGGIRPNDITWTGFGIGVFGALFLGLQLYTAALVFILMSRLADGLDGAVARAAEQENDYGGYLDIVLDFIFYSAVVFAFALGHPDQTIYAAFLIFSFIGTGASFLAYAVMAEKQKLETLARGKKSFFHSWGLAEGTETIVTFCLICLFPAYFWLIALIFGAMCWITTTGRILMAREMFG